MSNYIVTQLKKGSYEDSSEEEDSGILVESRSGYTILKRRKPAAIKLMSLKNNRSETAYYYTALLTFVPFRDEDFHSSKRENP